jgi:hypothetical protein
MAAFDEDEDLTCALTSIKKKKKKTCALTPMGKKK